MHKERRLVGIKKNGKRETRTLDESKRQKDDNKGEDKEKNTEKHKRRNETCKETERQKDRQKITNMNRRVSTYNV